MTARRHSKVLRKARQDKRKAELSHSDKKEFPFAAKQYITFGGDWEMRKKSETAHLPMKRERKLMQKRAG